MYKRQTLGGVRAACAMKHVGLNVAADPLFTISYQGLNAGDVYKRQLILRAKRIHQTTVTIGL